MGILAAGRPDLISFAPGYPGSGDVRLAGVSRHRRRPAAQTGTSETLQYGPTRGYGPLIEAVVPRLRAQGITCTTDEILLTTGSQQAVDLVTRLFVDPGDVVLVELPTFTGAIAAFRVRARAWSASGRRPTGSTSRTSTRCWPHERAAGRASSSCT